MLVLTRKANESIRIGPNIEVSVVAIRRNKARLLVSVPPGVAISRAGQPGSYAQTRVILNRKAEQSIRVGAHIEVKVRWITRSSVELGITAPSSLHVLRGEGCDRDRSRRPAPTRTLPRAA